MWDEIQAYYSSHTRPATMEEVEAMGDLVGWYGRGYTIYTDGREFCKHEAYPIYYPPKWVGEARTADELWLLRLPLEDPDPACWPNGKLPPGSEQWVIHCAGESAIQHEPMFWSNRHGWGALSSATVFSAPLGRLPVGKGVAWVELPRMDESVPDQGGVRV